MTSVHLVRVRAGVRVRVSLHPTRWRPRFIWLGLGSCGLGLELASTPLAVETPLHRVRVGVRVRVSFHPKVATLLHLVRVGVGVRVRVSFHPKVVTLLHLVRVGVRVRVRISLHPTRWRRLSPHCAVPSTT